MAVSSEYPSSSFIDYKGVMLALLSCIIKHAYVRYFLTKRPGIKATVTVTICMCGRLHTNQLSNR